MKQIFKTALFTLLIFWGLNSSAQTKEHPWYVGLGYNVVDFYPNGEGAITKYGADPFSDVIFAGFFNTEHYNISALSLKLLVGRYIGSNFSIEVSGSYNNITNWGSIPISSLGTYSSYTAAYSTIGELDYFSGGINVKYSFRNAINPEGWADPFVGLGGGATMVEVWNNPGGGTTIKNDFLGTGNVNLSAGLGIWLTERISLMFETSFKYVPYDHDIKNFVDSHFQHFLGLKYNFNYSIRRNKPCY